VWCAVHVGMCVCACACVCATAPQHVQGRPHAHHAHSAPLDLTHLTHLTLSAAYVDVNFTAKVEDQLDQVSGECEAV
jgi:hypothetical protein